MWTCNGCKVFMYSQPKDPVSPNIYGVHYRAEDGIFNNKQIEITLDLKPTMQYDGINLYFNPYFSLKEVNNTSMLKDLKDRIIAYINARQFEVKLSNLLSSEET